MASLLKRALLISWFDVISVCIQRLFVVLNSMKWRDCGDGASNPRV